MATNWPSPFRPETWLRPEEEPTWTDTGLAALSTVPDIVGGVAGAIEYGQNALGVGSADSGVSTVRRAALDVGSAIREGISPAGQEALGASFIPGEGEASAWNSGSLWMKGASMVPYLAASIIPGGLAARIALTAGASTRTAALAGAGAARATESVLNTGDVAGQIYSTIEGMSDEELMQANPLYAGYVSSMGKEEARRVYMQEVAGAAPAITGAITAAFGGLESRIAARIGGQGISGGILARTGKGAGGEAGAEAAQSGVGAFTVEEALASAGIKDDIDWQNVIAQTIEGTVLGGAMGGAVGAVIGGGTASGISPVVGQATTVSPATNANAPQPAPATGVPGPAPVTAAATLTPTNSAGQAQVAPALIPTPTQGGGRRVKPGPLHTQPFIVQPAPVGTADPLTNVALAIPPNEVTPSGVSATVGTNGTGAAPAAAYVQPIQDPIASSIAPGAGAAVQTPPPTQAVNTVSPYQVQPQMDGATAAPPSTRLPVGDPQNQPKRTGKRNAKKPAVVTVAPITAVETVESTGPDSAQSAALGEQFTNAIDVAAIAVPPAPPQVTPQVTSQTPAPAGAPAAVPPGVPFTQPGPQQAPPSGPGAASSIGTGTPPPAALVPPPDNAAPGAAPLFDPTIPPNRDQFPPGFAGYRQFTAAAADWRNMQQAQAAPVAPPPPAPAVTAGAPPTPPAAGAGGPRILQDQSPLAQESLAITEAQNAAIAENIANLNAPPPVPIEEKPIVGEKMGEDKRAERIRTNQVGIRAIEENPPQEVENGVAARKGPSYIRARESLKNRMQAMLDTAKAEKIKIPQSFKPTADKEIEFNGPLMVVRDAQRLLNKKNARDGTWGVTPEELQTFVAVETAVRMGDIEEARRIRVEAGDAVKKRGSKKGTVEGYAAESEEDPELDELEGVSSLEEEAQAAPEEIVEPEVDVAEETSEPDTDEDVQPQRDQFPKGVRGSIQFNKATANWQDAYVERSAAREGVEVETPRMRDKRIAAEKVAVKSERAAPKEVAKLTPKVTPAVEKIIVKTKRSAEQVMADRAAKEERVKARGQLRLKKETTDPVKVEEARAVAGDEEAKVDAALEPSLRSGVQNIELEVLKARIRGEELRTYAEAKAFHKRTLSDWLDTSEAVTGELANRGKDHAVLAKNYAIFADRIKDIAPDTEVYVFHDADYPEGFGFGAFDPGSNIIIMPERIARDEYQGALVILHEGVHAAFKNVIWSNPQIRAQLDQILVAVRNEWVARGNDPATLNGIKDIDELVADSMSDPEFQELLAQVTSPPALTKELGLGGRARTLWDNFSLIVKKALGIRTVPNSALDAVMRINSRLELGAGEVGAQVTNAALRQQFSASTALEPALRATMPWQSTTTLAASTRSPANLYWRTLDQIAQVSKDYGQKFGKAVRGVSNALESMRVRGSELLKLAHPLIRKDVELERKYRGVIIGTHPNGDPITQWQAYTELLHDETMTGVYADRPLGSQKHLGKKSLRGKWARQQHADLQRAYNQLPADLKQQRSNSLAYFKTQQDRISKLTIRNILHAIGIYDSQLEQRLHSGTPTAADKTRLGDVYDHLMSARGLRSVKGPYFPLMRFGDWVVRGTYNLKQPTNARGKVNDNTWEFDNRTAFENYLASIPKNTRPHIRTMYVDKNTNSPWVLNSQGQQIRITKADPNAEWRGHVILQDQHVEFFETKAEARAAEDAYRKSGLFSDVKETVPRRKDSESHEVVDMSQQMKDLMSALQAKPGFQALSKFAQDQMIKSLQEAQLRVLGSTRVQARFLPRTYVQGASRNFPKATYEYARATSNLIARLEIQGDLDKAVKGMSAEVDGLDTKSAARTAIEQEVKKRVSDATVFEDYGLWGDVQKRVSTAAYIRFLASPAYSMLQALQTPMVTLPQLAARHGISKSARTLFKVYDDLGAGIVTKRGLKETLSKVTDPNKAGAEFMDTILANVKDRGENAMLRRLMEWGSISRDAGMEVGTLVQEQGGVGGAIDKGLGWMQGVATQMPRAIETVNRASAALAAYRLEKSKGASHEKAVLYAQEVTNLTQGLYSHTDAPPIFKHPLGRIAFQFKKYGQLVYGLMGHHIGKAIRNANPGDRAEALWSLGLTLGAHVLMAGALGLPTEPIKFAVMAANAVGLTDMKWIDVENASREIATDWFGATAGEALTRGVTRLLPDAIAFDLSSRVGWSDLALWGEPDKAKPDEWYEFLGKFVGGAQASMGFEWLEGSGKLMSGDLMGAAEKMAPAKILVDSMRAIRQSGEGKKTAAGYEAMSPYNMTEAFLRGIGLTPAREAESQEQRVYYRHAQASQSEERTELLRAWNEAEPNERMRLWGQVEAWNRGKTTAEKVTRSELEAYRKRRRTEERKGTVHQGFRVSNRDRALYQNTQETYNLR